MDSLHRAFIISFLINNFVFIVNSKTYNIRIVTDTFINEVDSKFLSFQIDPKFLFSESEEHRSKESTCMASALTPAYLQVAGPSTSQITFKNYIITLQDKHDNTENVASDKTLRSVADEKNSSSTIPEFVATPHQWASFVKWAQKTGFNLVFALNNEEKTNAGIWDPNSSLSILTVAEIANTSNVYWQLGYKCTNQSIEEYLNDLETLRVIVETFPTPGWKVIGSDVTACLRGNTDFRDYVTLAVDSMDAVILNGNTTAREVSQLSPQDRYKLFHLLTKSNTPLWLTDSAAEQNHLERAADWIISLGYAARNGFSVHFRELTGEEVFKPTLSFYMALLYKNLVGERVLNLEDDDDQVSIFAHCTSLRHKPIPGALTLYAVNMEEEPARFSIKLTKKEDGGDIMQFILGKDSKGNIIVNSKAMQHEGDIKPVVKRVRPYKTLLLNLPSKSFGFWVLANTKIPACQDLGENNIKGNATEGVKQEVVTEPVKRNKLKRSISFEKTESSSPSIDISNEENDDSQEVHPAIQERIDFINKELKTIRHLSARNKRQFLNDDDNTSTNKEKRFKKKHALKSLIEKLKNKSLDMRPKFDILRRIFELHPKINMTFVDDSSDKNNVSARRKKIGKTRISKRDSDYFEKASFELKTKDEDSQAVIKYSPKRQTRSILNDHSFNSHNNKIDESKENQVNVDNKENNKLKEILSNLQKELDDLALMEHSTKHNYIDSVKDYIDKSIDGDSQENLETEKIDQGLINSSLKRLLIVLNTMNKNVNRLWNALNVFE